MPQDPAAEPLVTQPEPFAVEVEAGQKLFWCACGRTKNGAFCDGSHKGTGLKPVVEVAEEAGTKYLCGCKRTTTPPWCDGSHARL
ncbi:CDGSH iron-sulfur domain-containing protein [Caenispirillum salinarum]|uniref:CDGSH iron-sulfur domain-containing protein n=1 Tax=Caenispirillum salinarum TaxID=859058 RepID=UPI0038504A9E